MQFTETTLPGMFVIDADVFEDERGSFEAPWQREVLDGRGLETGLAQANLATSRQRGTIRGMHFQAAPFEGVKLVRVIRGAAFDVAVDLRPSSPTFRQWHGVELSAANRRLVYVPRGFAHGYQTLVDDTHVLYFVSATFAPEAQRGVRWNDRAFDIAWPLGDPSVIS